MEVKRAYYEYPPYRASIMPKRNQNLVYYKMTLRHEGQGLIEISEDFQTVEKAKAFLATKYGLLLAEWKP